MPSETKLLFLNHASFLVKIEDQYLLTDPWYTKPAFGSWLPVPPMYVHPVYLTSIKNLKILISHAHDDHFDDDLLGLFDKNTHFITANFNSKSVTRRLQRLGFKNIQEVDAEGADCGAFHVKSFINPELSYEDAVYSIRTNNALVVHANDCWTPFTDTTTSILRSELAKLPKKNAILFSQTNSASGFPLTYENLSKEEVETLLISKIKKMTIQGLKNASQVGITKFIGYAGYSLAFVKDHPEYLSSSKFPLPSYISSLIDVGIENVELLDVSPGDIYSFQGGVERFFPEALLELKECSINFYNEYGLSESGESYHAIKVEDRTTFLATAQSFLLMFEKEVLIQIERKNYESTILGKVLQIEIEDLKYVLQLKFGYGLGNYEDFNKKIIVSSSLLNSVFLGHSTFENLYVGYNARFERNPVNIYNRDIVMHLINFSYKYQNQLGKNGSK